MLTTSDLFKRYDCEMVGGDAIGRVDGKRVVLARNTVDGWQLTADGVMLASSTHPLDLDAQGEPGGSKPGKRGKRKADDAPAEPTGEDTTAAAEPDPVADAQLSLALDDIVEPAESFGG